MFRKVVELMKRKDTMAFMFLSALVALLLVLFLVVLPSQENKGALEMPPPLNDQNVHPSQYAMSNEEQCNLCQPMLDDDALDEKNPNPDGSYNFDSERVTVGGPGENYPVECRTPWSALEQSDPRYMGGVSDCTMRGISGEVCPNYRQKCTPQAMEALKSRVYTTKFDRNGRPRPY
jgi:hypothetical protein